MAASKTGREIALERRMALSKSGKANVDTTNSHETDAIDPVQPAETTEMDVVAPLDARERRRRMSATGKAHLPAQERTRAMVMQATTNNHSAPPVVVSQHVQAAAVPRSDAQQRRAQLSKYGKAALSAVHSPAEASRTRAQALRASQSQFGKGAVAASTTAPAHTETPVSDSSEDVTGTPVAQHPEMTGADRGLCREVTGTEYFSDDVFKALCPRPTSRPEPVHQGVQVTGRVATSQLLRPQTQYADDTTADGLPITGGEAVRSRVTGTDGDRSPRSSRP
jgi:Carboxysome shell peptide mid-region.